MVGSKKPCPGCGTTEPEWPRPAKEVCIDCKRLLEDAAWMKEQLSKMAEDEVIVAFGKYPGWNQHIYSQASTSRGLMDIFHQIAKAASRPTALHRQRKLFHKAEIEPLGKIDTGSHEHAIMSKPLAEAIRALRDAVQVALTREYEKGKEDGHNLLMRLATGDVSQNEFSAVAETDKHKQSK